MLELMVIFLSIYNFDIRCSNSAQSRMLCWFNGGSDETALLLLFLFKFRYVRMLRTIVCSGPLVLLFSLALGAVKLGLKRHFSTFPTFPDF